MGWQFLSDDDRRKLTGELAKLDRIWEGSTGRSTLLTMAGLASLISRLNSLANSAAEVFAAELVSALENETTLPEQPHHQALGLLLEYVLLEPDIPRSTQELCAYMIGRYRLIDDEKLLARLAAEYGAPEVVTPWRDNRRLSAMQRLNRLTVVAVIGVLMLAVVAWRLLVPDVVPPLVLPTDYRVSLTIDDGCVSVSADNLWEVVDAIVNNDRQGRARVLRQTDDADLALRLSCDGEDHQWSAQWIHPAPIFEIVGSPREIVVSLTNPATADLNRLARAMIYYGTNDFAVARDLLAGLVEEFPSAELEWLHANTLLLTEDYEAAVTAFDRLLPQMEGDAKAYIYNNRSLAHLDEYHRIELDRGDPRKAGPPALADLTLAQTTPMTTADAIALVNSNVGVAEAMLGEPDELGRNERMDHAREACLAAESAKPDSAWARVCQAAVIIEPLKFRPKPTCQDDKYAEAKALLDEAEKLQPTLAATYHWQARQLNYRFRDCPSDLDEAKYVAQCNVYRQRLITLVEEGLAPLSIHDRFLEQIGDCNT